MKLSIITVCYNNLAGLKKTFDTLKKDLDAIEWIIVDGASKDGTVEYVNNSIISRWGRTVFLTEPDKGIFDAMNKGIERSSGEYLLFLNSGDTLEYRLNEVAKLNSTLEDINVFGITKVDKFNRPAKWHGMSEEPDLLKGIPLPHQSTIVKKTVFNEIGGYDLNYKLLADHDFFSRAYVRGYKFKFFNNIVLATFFLDGASSNLRNSNSVLKELNSLQMKNFNAALPLMIKLRYYYKYFLSLLPFSERLMSASRDFFFRKYS